MTTEAGTTPSRQAKQRPATSNPNKNDISKGLSPGCRSPRRRRDWRRLRGADPRRTEADRSGCGRAQGAGPRACGRRQAVRSGEVQARRASVRHLRAAEGARREKRVSEAAGQFPLALLRPVLRRAEPELLHVPAAAAERNSESCAARGARRPRRAIRRRLRRMSRRAPISRSARSKRRTPSP